MSTATSASRFDERRRFTGVFQQTSRVLLDSDWNEEIRIHVSDARRRTADVAHGSPDDGYLAADTFVVDRILSTSGWIGTPLDPNDERYIPPQLTLDRYEPESLPFVVRSRGHTELRRTLPAPLDLASVPLASEGTTFAAGALVVGIRFEVPANEEEDTDVKLVLITSSGDVTIPLGLTDLPAEWTELRFTSAQLVLLGVTEILGYGFIDLPPRAKLWVDSLKATSSTLDRSDFVVRGGDGTLAGAGRMLADGVRLFLESDVRYRAQADLPGVPPLPVLAPDDHFFVYLDVWEQPITVLDDDFLLEPALDGLDTTTRERVVSQVRVQLVTGDDPDTLPAPTGGGALTTVFADGDPTPLRYPPEKPDACRDRCLFTESIATGKGYRGTDNLHVRLQVLDVDGRAAVLWSRENASVVVPLSDTAAAGASVVTVPSDEAEKLSVGDLVLFEDRLTRLAVPGAHTPVLRRVRAVDMSTGTVELDAPGSWIGLEVDKLLVGGPLPFAFDVADRASLRRFDGADWIEVGERYNLPDGIDFAFSGAPADHRAGDFWSFTARIHHPDGQAVGKVEELQSAPPHGPVHHHVPLARIREPDTGRVFEDLRPRFLPLAEVRDRLIELGRAQEPTGPFIVVVGDGKITHGDIDQDEVEGITGDEAIQAALRRVAGIGGGTVYIRAGVYILERPIIATGLSNVRILGDGFATRVTSVSSGGALWIERCGAAGPVSVEDLALVVDPALEAVIGSAALEAEPPEETPLQLTDLRAPAEPPADVGALAATIKLLGIGQGRVMATIRATLDRLRELQKQNQGVPLEDIPEAAALLEVLRRLPHGALTVADSNSVRVTRCLLKSMEAQPISAGAFITGTCEDVDVSGCRVEAASGVLAAPLAVSFSNAYLATRPVAGLALQNLTVRGNEILARGEATLGVRVADGALDGVRIEDNLVRGFAVGIEVDDRLALGTRAAGRLLVSNNRVLDGTVAGILAAGDGLDVAGNEIRPAESDDFTASSGLFHAGIQVTGQHVRVRSSWITLPPTPNAPVLGSIAGIVVGDGLDDGKRIPRSVFDVEIMDNRIEGAGASTLAAGVLICGPQPVYDIRATRNVVQNLGDAAVRVHGTAPVGNVTIEDNRFQEVALAETPAVRETLSDELALLAPGLTVPQGTADPEELLAIALADGTAAARPALDAGLRWIEKVTLRGAVVLSNAEDTIFRNNQVRGVGRYQQLSGPRPLGAEMRTAGFGIVGGRDVAVEGNRIEDVRAPVTLKTIFPAVTLPKRPLGFSALDNLDLLLKTGARSQQADLHAAVSALHRRLAEYTGSVTARATIGRSLYVALDAVTEALDIVQENALAGSLRVWTGALRADQSEEAHTRTAASASALVAQIGRTTTTFARAKDAYLALEKTWAAILTDSPAAIPQILTELPELLTDVPGTRADAIKASLTTPPEEVFELIKDLAWLASFRDEEARKSALGLGEAKGYRRDIIASLARNVRDRIGSLPQANNTAQLIGWMRSDVRGLGQMLREAGSHHAAYLESDFGDIDRKDPDTSEGVVARFQDTVGRILGWASAADGESTPQEDADAEAAVRVADKRGLTSLRLLTGNFVDAQLGLLSGLDQASDALGDAALLLVIGETRQLGALVEDDHALAALVTSARGAINDAMGADTAAYRAARLQDARSAFTRIRGLLAAELTSVAGTFTAKPSAATPQRLAGLTASVLALRELGVEATSLRADGMKLLDAHVLRGIDEAGAPLATREAAADALSNARAALIDDPTGADAEPRVQKALSGLATSIEQIASSAAGYVDTPAMSAAAVLVRAADLGLVATGTEAERVTSVHAYLAARKIELSPGVHARILGQTTLASLLAGLREALEGIAATDAGSPSVAPSPGFATLPDPADGVLACCVAGSLRVVQNHIESALTGASVTGGRGHVLAQAAFASPSAIQVCDNEITACGAGALDLLPGGSAVLTVESNRITGCADLGAADGAAGRNGALPPVSTVGQAVVRVAGRGELFFLQNLFYENGNDHADHLLHEVYIDFRGDVVVRGNTVRHGGGGAGGAGLLLVVEDLDTLPASASELVRKLVQNPALIVDRPPEKDRDKPHIGRLPWRPLGTLHVPAPPRVITKPLYVARAEAGAATKLLHFIQGRPPLVLLPRPVAARRSVHVEGNRVHASGPALLLLGSGSAIITATISANELVSDRPTGAVYLRHADATVFAGNHATCTAAVNVVVLRLDVAPASISGNVILGAQRAPQSTRTVLLRRDALQRFVGLKLEALKGALPDIEPDQRDASGAVIVKSSSTTPPTYTTYSKNYAINPGARLTDFSPFQIPAALRPVLTPATPTGAQPAPPRPNPYAHSLVVIGGSNVVAIGNATTAGALIHDADDSEDHNI